MHNLTNKNFILSYHVSLKKLNEGKPFTIQFNGEKQRVTRDHIILLENKLSHMIRLGRLLTSKNNIQSGGFLPLLGMIPSILGGIGKLRFTGQGLDFPLDEEGNEKEGGILPALGALLSIALKALTLSIRWCRCCCFYSTYY